MSTENIVKNKYYRILKDKTNAIWDRISFWTHADDVELGSGTTLSSDLTEKQTKIDKTQTDFAQVETSDTSAHAYTKGQMLLYNNQLYRVIAAIAVGNTLTVGTNIEAVSVSTLSSMLTANTGNQFYFDVKNGQYGFYPTAAKTSSTFVPFGGTKTIKKVATGGYKTYATEPNDIIVVGYYGTRQVDFSGSYSSLFTAYNIIDGTFKCGTYLVKATGTSVTLSTTGGSYYISSAQFRYE